MIWTLVNKYIIETIHEDIVNILRKVFLLWLQHKLIMLVASFSFCWEITTSLKDSCLSNSVVFSSCGKLGMFPDIAFKVSTFFVDGGCHDFC